MFTLDLDIRDIPLQNSSDNRSRPNILIIDDYVDFSDMFTMILNHLGYRVYQAYNGRDGLMAARTSKPDIIFCDINLPDLSGIEVARKLRQDERWEGAIMVALSGAPNIGSNDDIDLYFDRYAAKPVRTSVLHEILKVAEAR